MPVSTSNSPQQTITVKFITRSMVPGNPNDRWLRQFPGTTSQWGNCRFVLDVDATDYDWLVVYHDLPRLPWTLSEEQLHCPRENTILVTTEPSTITVYGTDYLRQFGTVLTSQEPWAISHPHTIFTQPALIWYYGYPLGEGKVRSFDEIASFGPPEKTRVLSTVCSSRQGRLTLHYKRYQFTERLQEALPEMDRFGQGVNPISDKAEMLDAYQYHITAENHVYPHHMTEKLPDAFLGYTVPFYQGCPNASAYFPPESFIHIDMNDFERTLDIIRSTIANNEYEDRLPYVIEARRRVLEEHNLFAMLERQICRGEKPIMSGGSKKNGVIMNRQTIRIKRPLAGIRSLTEKVITKSVHKTGLARLLDKEQSR